MRMLHPMLVDYAPSGQMAIRPGDFCLALKGRNMSTMGHSPSSQEAVSVTSPESN